ncbi:dienelactone hydrolase family protein [Pseudokordiimonas caeni]|uniref:dienelactone hydrolase family protein n=1 Tax=Pseudokordiimonas caeni TaxID=2997908 RepID=UPI002810A1DB|nr:dienelactone hydrolase family protein [Pseudokordiimonas caeni]
MGDWINIEAGDGSGSFKCYRALPAGGKGPVVIAIQEIFGINAGMRQICDELAAEGYIALSPDLFWRQEADVELTDKTDAEWQRAFALMQGMDIDKAIEDIATTIAAARRLEGASGKVGATGYCLGGLLAYLTACRTGIDATVSYYGVNIDKFLIEATMMETPLVLHIAGEDKFVSKEAQATIKAGLKNNPLVEVHVYDGKDHAFARPNGIHYDADAATLANGRTKDFFAKHLKA